MEFVNKSKDDIIKNRISVNEAESNLTEYLHLDKKLEFLGQGSEGFVFTDKIKVYKLIDTNKNTLDLYWKLSSFTECIAGYSNLTSLIPFSVFLFSEMDRVIITTDYYASTEFPLKKNIPKEEFIKLLKEFLRVKWVLCDFQPKNIRILSNNHLVVSDIGHSIYPLSKGLFTSMSRRAFVTYKIQGDLDRYEDFKKYITPVNTREDFSLLTELGYIEDIVQNEFTEFYNEIVS